MKAKRGSKGELSKERIARFRKEVAEFHGKPAPKISTNFTIAIVLIFVLLSVPFFLNSGITGLQAVNQVPVYSGASFNSSDGIAMVLSDYFSDPDGDSLSFSTSDPFASINSGILSFVAPKDYSGEYLLSISVSDGTNTVYKPISIFISNQTTSAATSQA